MTEKSETEHIDLNSDVVMSEPENEVNGVNNQSEAVVEANQLNSQNGIMGSLADGDISKESLESEVADRENSAENEKMGYFSLKEEDGKEGNKGSDGLESQDCAGKVGASIEISEAHLPSVEVRVDKESHKQEGVAFEAEKEKEKGFDELERSEHVEKGLVDENVDKEASFVVNPSSNLDGTSQSQSLEAPGSDPDVVQPQSTETDDVPVLEVERKVDPESLPQRECETAPSDGIQNGELNLNVHLEAQTKENPPSACLSGNASNSFNIVIDLSPRMDTGRNVKLAALRPEFGIGDLIWGKVRSHPWWPGQICDPSAASQKAKKYFKREGHLIAYFGDNTFAWNDASRIKPFLTHFSQMEKQSNTVDFHYAIDCVLEEVSRRVEFGLACSCISEEMYVKLKTQIIINTGLREDSTRRDGGDRSLTVSSFDPIKLIKYVKELAQVPYDGTDKLELTIARSQLLAFNRRKGYSQLPEFTVLGGLLDNDADKLPSRKKKHCNEVSGAIDPEQKDDGSVSEKGKSKSQTGSSLKRKLASEDRALPRKKEIILKDLIDEKHVKTPISKTGSESKVISKKRKADKAMSDDLPLKEKKSMATGVDNKSPQLKPTFRVGESIRRAASQLNGSSPILKNGDGMLKSPLVQTKSKEQIMSEEESKIGKLTVEDSPDEMLSQLCLAAGDPIRVNNLSMITFFSEFRNTVSAGLPSSEDDEESLENLFGSNSGKKSTKSGRKSHRPGITEPPPLESMNESYWSERIVRSIPEPEDQNETKDFLLGTSENKVDNSAIEPQNPLELDSELQTFGADEHLNDSCVEDICPTALYLNFTDLDSVPSEADLNKIFSCYESLSELETEVLKKSSRAKVVFRKRSDAEKAFSSAGKYSTFGPSLVSYRLRYLESTLSKASPNPKKRNKTETESAEEDAK